MTDSSIGVKNEDLTPEVFPQGSVNGGFDVEPVRYPVQPYPPVCSQETEGDVPPLRLGAPHGDSETNTPG